MLLDLRNPARFCRCSLFHQHCRLSCWCTHFTWSWNCQNDQHKLRMKTCAVILSPINCHPMNKQWTAPQNLMKNVDTDPESWGISKSFQYLQQNVPYHSMKYTKPVALYQLPGKDIFYLWVFKSSFCPKQYLNHPNLRFYLKFLHLVGYMQYCTCLPSMQPRFSFWFHAIHTWLKFHCSILCFKRPHPHPPTTLSNKATVLQKILCKNTDMSRIAGNCPLTLSINFNIAYDTEYRQ